MQLFRLLDSGSGRSLKSIAVVTSLSALANVALIGLINHVAEKAAFHEHIGPRLVILYLAIFAFYYMADRASLREANRLLQERLGALRQRVVGKISNTPLRTLEQLGQGELMAAVAQEMNHLAHNLPLFVGAAKSAFLLVFVLFYVAFLSLPSFLVLGACCAVGLFLFWRARVALNKALAETYAHEAEMMDTMASFVEGFQEIRLNADKSDSLFRRFGGVLDNLEHSVLGIGNRWVTLLQFANAFVYALIGVVIFVLPVFFDGYNDTIYKIAAAATFCIGPITAITGASHLLAKADVGLGHVFRLEERLDQLAVPPAPAVERSRFAGFDRIDFEGVTFSYRDAAGDVLFTSGPWSLTLRRGEIVFFTGGNGSGKSTVMKLLCLLYMPDAGRILVDGVEVTEEARQDFRELFCAIFPDFHLFDRLYGLEDMDHGAVLEQIIDMGLAEKVEFIDGRFSTTDLSTGQRKRLAMIVSRLEDRDIYLFDEWAADQDAGFREVFYKEILPTLKADGKTVIAVTHDDRYWHCCDRHIAVSLGHMEVVPTADSSDSGPPTEPAEDAPWR